MSPRPHLRLVRGEEPEEHRVSLGHPAAEGRPDTARGNQDLGSRREPQPVLGSLAVAQVSISPQAARELDGLPLTIKGRILAVFERLGRWPEVSGAKPMRGELAGLFRIRTGDYRVLFRVEGRRVIVERVGHRDRFYED